MDLVDKRHHFRGYARGCRRGPFLKCRTTRLVQLDTQLIGQHVGQGRLTEVQVAPQKYMIERLRRSFAA